MLDLLKDALATARLSRLITEDVILNPVREKIFEKYPPTTTSPSYLLTCPWCASVWIAGGVVVLRKTLPKQWDYVATALALSHVAATVDVKTRD